MREQGVARCNQSLPGTMCTVNPPKRTGSYSDWYIPRVGVVASTSNSMMSKTASSHNKLAAKVANIYQLGVLCTHLIDPSDFCFSLLRVEGRDPSYLRQVWIPCHVCKRLLLQLPGRGHSFYVTRQYLR